MIDKNRRLLAFLSSHQDGFSHSFSLCAVFL